jgi:RimJ/RimL family protein N-acetyltransferase
VAINGLCISTWWRSVIISGEMVVDFARDYFKMPFINAKGIGFENNNRILGCIIFDNYRIWADGSPCSMECSVLVLDKKCINRYSLKVLFTYCFAQCNLRSLIIRCHVSENKKRDLIERMGFVYEGIERECWPYGGDAARYSMLNSECKWL